MGPQTKRLWNVWSVGRGSLGAGCFNGAANKILAEFDQFQDIVVSVPCFNGAANKTLAGFLIQYSMPYIMSCFNGAANKTLAEYADTKITRL